MKKKNVTVRRALFAAAIFFLSMAAQADDLLMWYPKPASYWEEALPLGNGRLAAMVSGSVAQDTIQLNEDTFWSGSPYNNYNENCKTYLQQMRDGLQKGTQDGYIEAQKLALKYMVADRSKTSHGQIYESVGRLLLTFPGQTFSDEIAKNGNVSNPISVTNYKRWLNLKDATVGVSYECDGVKYARTVFTSFKDNVTVIRLTADQAGKLNFVTSFVGPEKTNRIKATVTAYDNNTLMVRSYPGRNDEENIKNELECYSFIRIVSNDGTLKVGTQSVKTSAMASAQNVPSLEVNGATEVTLIVSSATNFVDYSDISADAQAKALGYIEAWQNKNYDTALSEHIGLYKEQFGRVSLSLGDNTTQSAKDTETRISEYSTTSDPSLASMYFQFGRYLLISSSQPGSQPANLQGIWNPDGRQYPAWDSKYTTNINVEMNYWPSEITNLSECHQPFLQLIKDVSVPGRESAEKMYGCNGWMLHHNTDLWRMTGAVDNATSAIWPTCNAWFCSHIWEHYLYSGDKNFLAEYYPILKGAAEFYQGFLYKDKNTGYMVAGPSISPENHPGLCKYTDDDGKNQNCAVFQGVTMDNAMIYDLLKNTATAARILGQDGSFANELDALRAQLPPMRIGKYGQLQEWQEDWDREYSGHRHLSHLWGAFPGSQVSPYENADLFQGVHKSLVGRGDDSRGWSMGWKVCLWARMLDGDHAMTLIKNQLKLKNPNATISDANGGTYANMFDSHPPFQIDGNFGCCAGIAEMLVQSHAGFMHILPALPSEWKAEGEVKGLRTRGGFEITDMKWAYGQLVSLKIKSNVGGNLRLRTATPLKFADGTALQIAQGENTNPLMQPYNMPEPVVKDKAKIPETLLPETSLYDIPTTAGQEIELVPQQALYIWTGADNRSWNNVKNWNPQKTATVDDKCVVSDNTKNSCDIDGGEWNGTLSVEKTSTTMGFVNVKGDATLHGKLVLNGAVFANNENNSGILTADAVEIASKSDIKAHGLIALNAPLTGDADVTMNGRGTLKLEADGSAFNGNFTLNSDKGKVIVAAKNAMGKGTITVNASNTLQLDVNDAIYEQSKLVVMEGGKAFLNAHVALSEVTLGGQALAEGVYSSVSTPNYFTGEGTLTVKHPEYPLEWTAAKSSDWNVAENYTPSTLPKEGDVINVNISKTINFNNTSIKNVTVNLNAGNVRLTKTGCTVTALNMAGGTYVNYVTGGNGFVLNGPINIAGDVTFEMTGGDVNSMTLNGKIIGEHVATVKNGRNNKLAVATLILGATNDTFTGTWDLSLAQSFEGNVTKLQANTKDALGESIVKIANGNKLVLNADCTISKLFVDGKEMPAATYTAATLECLEGEGKLTVQGTATGIGVVNGNVTKSDNTALYNVNGVRVKDGYKGIVVCRGKTYVRK